MLLLGTIVELDLSLLPRLVRTAGMDFLLINLSGPVLFLQYSFFQRIHKLSVPVSIFVNCTYGTVGLDKPRRAECTSRYILD